MRWGLLTVGGALAGVALGFAGCADDAAKTPPGVVRTPLPLNLTALAATRVLPGTDTVLGGTGFLGDAEYTVTLSGEIQRVPVEAELKAAAIDDRRLAVTFPVDTFSGAPPGQFTGEITVLMEQFPDAGQASVEVSFEHLERLSPVVNNLPQVAFPATPIPIIGADFISGSEGQVLVDIDATFTPDGGGRSAIILQAGVPAEAAPAPPGRWNRDEVRFVLDPAWLGVRPGQVSGTITVTNQGVDWSTTSGVIPFEVQVLSPVIQDVSPGQASRGQRITVDGQGFLGGDLGGFTTIRLDGTFTPTGGSSVDTPEGGVVLAPIREDANTLALSFSVRYDTRCRSEDLGANPGRFEGTATALIEYEGDRVVGPAFPLAFDILPPRQVVWLRFLPSFTDSLRLFGLRNVSGRVQERILEVLQRDYTGINVEIRQSRPEDFLEFSVVEVGGPDPNAAQLFGLDNTPGLDRCNQRLDDNLAGRNADSDGAYGGIFVESFLQLSARDGTDNPLATPKFDELFDPVRNKPVESGEFPGGGRDAVIERAIMSLGNLVGNTVSHEIGHSLGLPVFPGCGQFHNAPGDGQIMDCGGDRPFEERVEFDQTPAARFNDENRHYLELILPIQ